MQALEDSSAHLAHMATEIVALETIGQAWPLEQRVVLERMKEAIEALHRDALLRLITQLRTDPNAAAQLKVAVRDPVVFGVLRLHGLVRDPLHSRVAQALESVAPMLAEHGGGVELVDIVLPDTVQVRLTGSCQSCPASGQTLSEGVERAIKAHAPEIVHVVQVKKPVATRAPGEAVPLHFVSPFARASDTRFEDVCALQDLPLGQIVTREIHGHALLFYRDEQQVSCVTNACAHMGMPMDGGTVSDGILECPHHGFRYRLQTGECLDIPQVQLVVHAVRVQAGRVALKSPL